ncbi:hypothetical protein [Parasphingorhabdus sp.]|uniref:hypothetical protein n=1 Tax=Parasphingorhabdus sp. TaxID=2709688 RepID=UPI002F939690
MRVEQKNGHNPRSAQKIHRKDVGSLLIEEIRALAGPSHDVQMVRERPWASITFSGIRHSLLISQAKGGEATLPPSFADQIAEHEFDLPGHFVADILVDGMTIEILSIIDPVCPVGT